MAGDQVGEVALSEAVFGVEPNESVPLADAGDVDLVAFLEGVGLDDIAHIDRGAVLETELFEMLLVADARLVQVALLGLGQLLLGDVLVAELDGFIAFLSEVILPVTVQGPASITSAKICVFIEDLRHADLFTDDGCFHTCSSFRLLVSSLSSWPEAADLTRPHTQAADCGFVNMRSRAGLTGCAYSLMSISTPAGSSRFIRASTVLLGRVHDVDQALVGAALKLLAAVLILMNSAQDGDDSRSSSAAEWGRRPSRRYALRFRRSSPPPCRSAGDRRP